MDQQKNWISSVSSSIRNSAHFFTSFIILFSGAFAESHKEPAHEKLQAAIMTQETNTLLPGKTIKQKIAAGKHCFYQISLSSGQFVHLVFEGQDRLFAIALLTPSHHRILEFNSRRPGPTPLSFITQTSGDYTLEIRSLEADQDAAHCELTLDPVRKSVAQDKNLIAAEKASTEAEKLRAAWESNSLLQSINKYKKACTFWHGIKNQREEAIALKNIGEVYSTLSRNQKALDYFNQALPLSRIAGDRRLEIELLNAIGEIQIELGNWQSALDNCKQALSFSSEAGSIRKQAHSLNNIGLVYHLKSDFQKALDLFDQALKLWLVTGDLRGQAQTLTNIGYSHGDLGDLQKSLFFLNEALIFWRKSGDIKGEAKTLTTIALLNSSQGEIQEAFDTHTKAIRLFQRLGDQAGEAGVLNGLAYLYDTLGDKQKALDLYDKALQFFRAAGIRSTEAITIGLIGEMYYSMGDKQKALDYYKQKLAISQELRDQRAEAHTLKDMGMVFDSFGDKQKALDYFNRALSLSRTASDPRAQAFTLGSIGHIYERSGQRKKALDYYKEAIALNRATEDRAAEAQTLHSIARVTRDLDDLKEAYDQSKALLGIVETFREKVASRELQASYFASAHQHYELYIDILMRMREKNPTAGHEAAALEASERSRGRVLLDLLNEARADIRQGADPALLQQERDLQQSLNAKAERQIRLLSGPHTEEQVAAIRKEVADLTSQYEEVLTQIRATSRRYASLRQPRILSISEIQQQLLDADTTLLEYSLGDERSYVWAVTGTSATAYELPVRSKIEDAAIRLYRALTVYAETQSKQSLKEADSQYSEAANELARMLLEPVASHLETKRLVIVADGALQYVPFAALPDPGDAKQQKQQRRPLVVNHEIINLPSASIFSALRSEMDERSRAPKALAVLADPVYEKADPRVPLKGRPGRKKINSAATSRGQRELRSDELLAGIKERLRFQRLPFAATEAKDITSLVSEQERKMALGFDANLTTAKSAELQQYRIVHFATHGLIYGAHPQLYGVVLSLVDMQGNSQDGFLRLNEIYNLKLGADLVVLSACQTAFGKEIKGEGLASLARGFMYAGAARVVASLWKVDDRASAELMKHFYKGMLGQAQLRPAAALRAAQIEMWKQPRWRSPYFWAAFILQGEWK